jgi:DNA polymerase-3 subunit alpha
MGKKKPEEMAKQRAVFIDGAVKRGVEPGISAYVFDLMEKFSGYGFNKSHSAAYALISYQTAWLKTHYPAAFMAAVLSSDMDNTDKVVVFIEECRSMGLTVVPPAINASEYRFTVSDQGQILYGLGAVKGVGEAAIESLLEERQRQGWFVDIFDLCRRVDLRKVNRRVLESLIRAGACDNLGCHRATLMAQLPEALRLAEQNSHNDAAGQEDLFGLRAATATPVKAVPRMEIPPWSEEIRLAGEKETLGLYLTGHPISRFEAELKHFISGRLADLSVTSELTSRHYGTAKPVVIAGLVVAIRIRSANRSRRMAFVTLDDRTARMEIRVFPEIYEQYRDLIANDKILVVQGSLVWDDFSESVRLNAERLFDIDAARNEFAQRIVLSLDADRCSADLLQDLAVTLAPHREGKCPIWVDYRGSGSYAQIILGREWWVRPTETLLQALRELVGAGSVRVVYPA